MKKLIALTLSLSMFSSMTGSVHGKMLIENKAEYTQAETNVETLKNTYQEKVNKVSELQKDYDAANTKYKSGAYGFFKAMKSTSAIKILNSKTYKKYIKQSDDTDAISITNMRAAIALLQECNTLRKNQGFKTLKVSDDLIAQSLAYADYSDATSKRPNNSSVNVNIDFSTADDPYTQWYTEGKAKFDALVKKKYPKLKSKDPNVLSALHSNLITSDTVYYLNTVDSSAKYTGLAKTTRDTKGWHTYIQIFTDKKPTTSYSVMKFSERFENYVKPLEDTINAYNTAVKERDEAFDAYNNAQDSLTDLSKAKIGVKKDKMTYTGKATHNTVSVILYGKLVDSTNYSITEKNNTKIGKATITIKGLNDYNGEKSITYQIVPKKTSLVSTYSLKKKQATVIWKAQKKQTTGYIIAYSTSKSMKKAKTKTVSSNKTTSVNINKLKSKKTYYIKVATYKKVGKKKYISNYSKAKKVKVK